MRPNAISAPPDRLPREGESIFVRAYRPDYVIDENGCWIWQKTLLNGYAVGSRGVRMHRAYFERAYGPIPDGHDVHHRCKVVACINPEHLMAVDARQHDIEHFMRGYGRDLEVVRAIREAGRQPGVSAIKVAEQFGVHYNTVKNYWKGKGWSDLLGEDGPVVTPPQVCALEGCDEPAIGQRRDKKYCTVEHRELHNRRQAQARKVAA